jgi:hypothetical protein
MDSASARTSRYDGAEPSVLRVGAAGAARRRAHLRDDSAKFHCPKLAPHDPGIAHSHSVQLEGRDVPW